VNAGRRVMKKEWQGDRILAAVEINQKAVRKNERTQTGKRGAHREGAGNDRGGKQAGVKKRRAGHSYSRKKTEERG